MDLKFYFSMSIAPAIVETTLVNTMPVLIPLLAKLFQ